MLKLAEALKQLEQEIPADIAWVLRVDGHTDTDPMQSRNSNPIGSCLRRAPSPLNFGAQGVQSKHLVAAGFGEFQPLVAGDTEDAKSENRRIELKLTER